MKNKRFFLFLLLAVLSLCPSLFSQEMYLKTEECDIYLSSNVYLKDVRIIEIGDSSFTIIKDNITKDFKTDNLLKIKFVRTGFWTGAAIGGLGSVAFWTILGALHGKGGASYGIIYGLAFALPSALIGGMIVEFASHDDTYNFKNAGFDKKVKILKYIYLKHQK